MQIGEIPVQVVTQETTGTVGKPPSGFGPSGLDIQIGEIPVQVVTQETTGTVGNPPSGLACP